MVTLYNDDCMNILRGLPDSSIDLIVTDPPYDISATNGGGSVNNIKKLNKSLNDLVDLDIDTGYDIETYNNEFVRVMKNINIYIWCNKVQIPEYFDFYVNRLGCKFDILLWYKTNSLPTYSNKYLTDKEYCLYFRKGGVCNPQSYEDAKTIYIAPINIEDKKMYDHPTIKPLAFTESMIRNSSRVGDIVLDPFMGSGTTGVACKGLGRNFIGVELNKKYFDISSMRINGCLSDDTEDIDKKYISEMSKDVVKLW